MLPPDVELQSHPVIEGKAVPLISIVCCKLLVSNTNNDRHLAEAAEEEAAEEEAAEGALLPALEC